MKLKVGRPAGGNSFTIIGESAFETPVANTLNTFLTRIPVQAGDIIGANYVGNTACSTGGMTGYVIHLFPGDPAVGSTSGYIRINDIQVDLSALLEPDCDSDGLGDETQDPNLFGGTCPIRARTLTLDANKNKVKKGKRVTLTGRLTELVRQGECQATQAVELQRKRPSQSTFTTIEQLQSDASGSFSAKEKVKKTFEYRAQVAETATCGPGLSNTEKVKVKKKR
jgi:hypothetical protein